MAYVTRYQATVNVTASGGVTHSANVIPDNGGWLESIVVRNATANGIITSAKLTIEQGGRTLWNATSTGATNTTLTWYPRARAHNISASAIVLEENATVPAPLFVKMPIAALVPINIQVASGGPTSAAARSVQVDLYIGG